MDWTWTGRKIQQIDGQHTLQIGNYSFFFNLLARERAGEKGRAVVTRHDTRLGVFFEDFFFDD